MPKTPLLSLFFFFFLQIILTASSPHSTSLPSDALALLSFKSKSDLNGNLRFPLASSHCHWQGVKCFGDRVLRLVIIGIPLGGIFSPNSLTRLDQLRVLGLQNDSLTGPIPDLSPLFNLKTLFLDHNSFSGSLPPSLSSLHRLRTLDLSHNILSGPLPPSLTTITRLLYFRVEGNRLNGSIPPFNQTSLHSFNVSGNDFDGAVPITPTLLRFMASSYLPNSGLCGEIVHKECRPRQPFFESSPEDDAPPPTEARGTNARVGGSVSQPDKHNRTAAVVGFSAGAVVLVASMVCFAMAVRKHRRKGERISLTAAADEMGSDPAAAEEEAAVVMRIEAADELGEKVKKAAQQHQSGGIVGQVAKGGSLVFCAGEAQVYTAEQLMRGSAELLGRGTMGTTYKAVLDNRLIVCVKRLDAGKTAVTGREAFERHMESVGGLRHPNLVPLRAYVQAKEERLLIYDYQPNGSLFSLIHGSKSARAKPLHWTSCLKIAEDVAQGLSYIHQAWRLVHGNLKSSNVLLGSDFEACLTDYCLAALAAPSTLVNDDLSSLGYKAPELRRPDRPSAATSKSDVYAYGILLLELLTGKPPSEFPYLPPCELMGWVRSVRRDGDGEEGKLEMVMEVAAACSVGSPEQRPTMWQVLKMIQEIKEAVLVEDSDELLSS